MIYSVGDTLICKKKVNSGCLEMTNHYYDIMPGDKFVVTDTDDWPENAECHWYELVPLNEDIVLNAWNDREHMVIDENFDKQNPPVISKEDFQELLDKDFAEAIETVRKKMQIENNF